MGSTAAYTGTGVIILPSVSTITWLFMHAAIGAIIRMDFSSIMGRATQEETMLAFIAQGAFFGAVLFALAWYRKKIETTLRHMKTDPGRKMAVERLPYVEDFCKDSRRGIQDVWKTKNRSEIQRLR